MKFFMFIGIVTISSMLCGQTPGGGVSDIDGNNYITVIIENQEWMAENLKTSSYRNGDPIPNVTDGVQWGSLTSGAFCWYDNMSSYENTYGKLYNWYVVDDQRNVCSEGWRVATEDDWIQLVTTIDPLNANNMQTTGSQSGGDFKQTGTIENGTGLWSAPNTGATNLLGMSVIPGGITGGVFGGINEQANFWISANTTPLSSLYTSFLYNSNRVYVVGNQKTLGMSIRCMKDVPSVGMLEIIDSPKTVVRIVDIMGRITEFKPNTVLIYIYSDGTTEKVFKVE